MALIADWYSQLSLTRPHVVTIGKSGIGLVPIYTANGLKTFVRRIKRWITREMGALIRGARGRRVLEGFDGGICLDAGSNESC